MAFLFGGGKKNDKPQYTSLQIQTSTSTLAIPIVWGMSRIAPNLIFYGRFFAFQVKGGGKGSKGGKGGKNYSYRADMALALCEGPIRGIGVTWRNRGEFGHLDGAIPIWDQSDNTVSYLWEFNGDPNQTTWGYFAAVYPGFALAFPSTAYLATALFDLGSSATIGEIACEVQGLRYGTGTNGMDADPALVIQDFLTSPQFGAQFDPTLIDYTTLLSAGGNGATVQDYCKAMGICFSPALINQEQGSSILTRWLQIINTAAVWSGNVLRFVPYGDTVLAAGQIITQSVTMTVPAFPNNDPNGFGLDYINVEPPGQFVADLGVKYTTQYYGVQLVFIGAAIPPGPGFYGRIGTTYYFSQLDSGIGVTITFQYTSAGGYTPNLQPLFLLADDDFIDEGGDSDPITVERVDPYTLPTIQRIEVLSRNNQYAGVPMEARDQSQAEIFGPRVATTIQAHEICDEINIAPIVAQAILQRQLYVRAKFKFKLDWTFCMLDPMDIIAINDAALGLSNYPVRITSIEEDDNAQLSVEAEELIYGVSSPSKYNVAGATSIVINQQQPANPVNNPPLLYEPPAAYSATAVALLGASSALPSGGADPNFGGASIYASLDGATYTYIAQVVGATPQGWLTAPLPATSGYDTTSTLSIDMSESGGTLTSSTAAAAQGGATLCLVGSELLAFATATLTAPNKYDLTGLQRGLYGTTALAHSAGVNFNYLASPTVLNQALPSQWIGQTVYLKFQSFNIFYQGSQPLDQCQVFIFTPTVPGSGQSLDGHPIAAQLAAGGVVDLGSVADEPPLITDDFGLAMQPPTTTTGLGPVLFGVAPMTSSSNQAIGPVDLGDVFAVDPIASLLQTALPNGTVDFGSVLTTPTTEGNFGPVLAPLDMYVDLETGSYP